MPYFLLITIILDYEKKLSYHMPKSNLSTFFIWSLGSEMQFYYYNQTSFESKKDLYSYLTQSSLDQKTAFFHFSMLQKNVLDWRTSLLFFCYHPTNGTFLCHLPMLLWRYFNKDINNLISQIFTSNGLGIPCITILFRLLY